MSGAPIGPIPALIPIMKSTTAVLCTVSILALAAPGRAEPLKPRITPAGQVYGDLKVTIGGADKTLADHVWKYWLFDGGRTLLWAGSDGAGGYENEGQSLWRYDARTGRKKKLGAFTYMINAVREARSRRGKRGFVASMSDGGLGAPHVAVVREGGGVVWQETVARLAAIRNGRIAVAVMRTRDLEAMDDWSKLPVRRMVYRELDRLLK